MRTRCVALPLVLLLAVPAAAQRRPPIRNEQANHTKMRAFNVGATAFFSVFSGMRQGQINSCRDFWRHLLIGGGAGAAFYESKRLAGNGKVTAGWLLANATATIVENTASGEHPIGRIGYTVGPLRLRVATPYVRDGAAKIDADVSIAQTILLGAAFGAGERVSFRNGLIAVDRDTPWNLEGRFPEGATFGVFPGVIPGAARKTWHHETVHAIQAQQISSTAEPVLTITRKRHGRRPLFALRQVRLEWAYLPVFQSESRDYPEQWTEVEAWWLAEGTPVRP